VRTERRLSPDLKVLGAIPLIIPGLFEPVGFAAGTG
jgi:hypothetical protein